METAKRIWDAWDDGAIAASASAPLVGARFRPAGAPRRPALHRGRHARGCRAAPSTGRCCSRPAIRRRAATSRPGRRTSSSPPTRKFDDALDVPPRHRGAHAQGRPRTPTTSRSCRPANSSSPPRRRRPWRRRTGCAACRSARSRPSPTLNSSGAGSFRSYDPDGPLPDIDPVVEETSETRGSGFHGAKARQLADQWRAEAKDKGLVHPAVRLRQDQPRGRHLHRLLHRGGRPAGGVRPHRRRGRVQHLAVADPHRPGRHRQPPRPGAAGTRRLPDRVRGHTLRENLGLATPVRAGARRRRRPRP